MAMVGKPFRALTLISAGLGCVWGFGVGVRGTKFPLLFAMTLVCMDLFGVGVFVVGLLADCIMAFGTMVGRPVALLDNVGISIISGVAFGSSTFLGMN